jgi:hypothetical protein
VVLRPPDPGGSGTVFQPIRVHAGGAEFTNPATHEVWSADTGFISGNPFKTTNPVVNSADPSEAPLYQTTRYGDFRYRFTVPNCIYTVTLKFAEIWYTDPKKRVFDVLINGERVLKDFDVVAAAGGPKIAIDKSVTVGPTDKILIEFKPKVDNAEISAIQIVEAKPK